MIQILHKAIDENGNVLAEGFGNVNTLVERLQVILDQERERGVIEHHNITIQQYVVYRK